jgi:hypothetical protein
VTASIVDFPGPGARRTTLSVPPSEALHGASPDTVTHASRGPAPDFRFTRVPADGARVTPNDWRVTVRVHATPAPRDEVVKVLAENAETAVYRALATLQRAHNSSGRKYLPALEVLAMVQVDTHH